MGAKCTGHGDCEAGQACIHGVCKSMDHVACGSDIDCPEYERCFDGQCAMCRTDEDCLYGYVCDYAGVCLPNRQNLIGCTQASECGAGETCLNGTCAKFCVTMGDCDSMHYPLALNCSRTSNVLAGVCEDMKSCDSNDDCHTGFECYQKRCRVIYCKSNSDCASGEVCDGGHCYAYECTEDRPCESESRVCYQNKCVQKVLDSGGCYDRQVRDGNACLERCDSEVLGEYGGKCVEDQWVECLEDSDCKNGGHCLFSKETTSKMALKKKIEHIKPGRAPSYIYIPETEISARCVSSCIKDEHCPDGMQCVQKVNGGVVNLLNKECRPFECTTDADCGENQFCTSFRTCRSVGKQCTNTEDAGENDISSMRISVSFDGHDADVEMGDETQEQKQCGSGERCANGYCMPFMGEDQELKRKNQCNLDSDCRYLGPVFSAQVWPPRSALIWPHRIIPRDRSFWTVKRGGIRRER